MKTILFFINQKTGVKNLCLAFSIFCTLSLSAQVSYLGSSSASAPDNSSNKLYFQHTVNPVTNFLVVTVTTKDKPIVSVKYGQQTLTEVISKICNSMTVAIYYLVNPLAGTDTVKIQTSDKTEMTAGAANYGNADIATPVIQSASSSGQSSSSASLIINSTGGDIVIDGIGTRGKHVSLSPPQSLVYNNAGTYPNASSYKTVTSSSTTTNWSIEGSEDWAMVSIVVKSATSIPVPLKFLGFNAILNKSKIDLNWTTAAELNVSHFVIEKSRDGRNFSEAGIVFARGNETDITAYSFSDIINTDQDGIVYYRLRSVDIDGKSQYSEIRIIRVGKHTENTITILSYPNPVSNELRITIPSNWQNKKITYELFNGNGQAFKRTETANSRQTETVNTSTLAPGFYIIRVSCEGQTAQQKIVKQ